MTCGCPLTPRPEGQPFPRICGGDFRTTDAETADEIAAKACERWPHADARAHHVDAGAADPALEGKGTIVHLARVEGYAHSFDCLELFLGLFLTFRRAVEGWYYKTLESA